MRTRHIPDGTMKYPGLPVERELARDRPAVGARDGDEPRRDHRDGRQERESPRTERSLADALPWAFSSGRRKGLCLADLSSCSRRPSSESSGSDATRVRRSGRAAVERGHSDAVVRGASFGDDGPVEFRILGPLEVVTEGRVVRLDAAKPRALLAILLLHANEPVPRDRLIEELWAGRPPSSAAKVLQTYVSQLRRAFGRDVIRTVSSAYELRADAGSFDLLRFEQLVGSARAAGPAEANGMLREALSLWRGQPLAEFAYEPWAQPEIGRLEELRRRSAAAADRDGSRTRRERRARPRARAAGRPIPASGGPPRPADARALPLGQAGGRARGVSRCEALARGDARDRADARAPAARALDPRPGSGARSRHAPSPRQTARRSRGQAWRVARRRSWGERASCGRSARFCVARRCGS